jgi:uncharacterized membrane protein
MCTFSHILANFPSAVAAVLSWLGDWPLDLLLWGALIYVITGFIFLLAVARSARMADQAAETWLLDRPSTESISRQ